MNYAPLLMVVLLCTLSVGPVTAAEIGRLSYITVQQVKIELRNEQATIDVQYKIDEGIDLLVLLIGKADLKKKLQKILLYEGAEFQAVDLDHAILVIDDASFDYGDGSYWFPEHTFGMILPEIVIRTPQTTRSFTITSQFPNGIGYFRVPA
ncbi:MAG: hypothetical protein RQ758_07790 [Methanomicrobiaceae archaeon]|nr:hypothetical protein [Methanomicrobiaceae archaeon]